MALPAPQKFTLTLVAGRPFASWQSPKNKGGEVAKYRRFVRISGGFWSSTDAVATIFTEQLAPKGATVEIAVAAIDRNGVVGTHSPTLSTIPTTDPASKPPTTPMPPPAVATPPPVTPPVAPSGAPVPVIRLKTAFGLMAPVAILAEASQSKATRLETARIRWRLSGPGTVQYTLDPISGATVNLFTDQVGYSASFFCDKPGDYDVTCSVTDENGNSGTTVSRVTIAPDTRTRNAMLPVQAVLSTPDNTYAVCPAILQWLIAGAWRPTLRNAVIDLTNGGGMYWMANPIINNQIVGLGASADGVVIRGGKFSSKLAATDPANNGYGFRLAGAKDVSLIGTDISGQCMAVMATGGSGLLMQNVTIPATVKYSLYAENHAFIVSLGGFRGPPTLEHQHRYEGPAASQFPVVSFCKFDFGDIGTGKNNIRFGGVRYATAYRNLCDAITQVGFKFATKDNPAVGWSECSYVQIREQRYHHRRDRTIELMQCDHVAYIGCVAVVDAGGTVFKVRADTRIAPPVLSDVTLRNWLFRATPVGLGATMIDTTDPVEKDANGIARTIPAVLRNWELSGTRYAVPKEYRGVFLKLKTGQFKKITGQVFTDRGENYTYAQVDGKPLNWAAWTAFVAGVNGGVCTDRRDAGLTPASVAGEMA